MDIGTFGSSEAAKTLVKILTSKNDKKLNRKVSRFLCEFNYGYYKILSIIKSDEELMKRVMLMWKNNYISHVDNNIFFEEDIKSFVKNIISTKYKMALEP